ncbi:MAG: PhoH family protein [Spirochaetales bacterium]|nr:PhoH family protein [Spirochaetales bacterium]
MSKKSDNSPNSGNNKKIFVIDTNVFIHKPDAILSFRDNEVVVPLAVLEELDNLKSAEGERGRNARAAIRFLDEMGSRGPLSEGVMMDNGSLLKVEICRDPGKLFPLDFKKNDNKIIYTAYALQEAGKKVFFVSKDISARVKAISLGVKAVDYKKQVVDIHTLYQGIKEITASEAVITGLKETGQIDWNEKLYPNQFVVFNRPGEDDPLLTRYDYNTGKLVYLKRRITSVWGIKPLNIRQRIALEILLDDSVSLVTLVGKAGTGKTLLSIAAGLKKTCEHEVYSKVLVSRPIIPMGKDIGYLPGAKETKLKHWMQPLFDNLEYIIASYKKLNMESAQELLTQKMIEIEGLTYIRGRSLPHQYIIIDEAQNLSPHEVKTIVSRAGEGTKVVLTGDPFQIDTPYLDSNSNGLSFLVEAFKGQKMYGHVTLEKSERSPLAELATELL